MVNFRDPVVILMDEFALLKFWHVVDGIYIWEFITNLGFEWSIIRGHRPYRWTIWIYALTRLSSLMTVIVNLILLNNTIIISCQVSAIFEMIPAYLAVSTASLLLVIRIIAIWDKNPTMTGLAVTIWCVNGAFLIEGVSRFRQGWDNSIGTCTPINFQSTKLTMIGAFVTDILLLIVMLAGLFRLGCHRQGSLATGRFLWNQGVVWIFLATFVGMVPVIFVCLNLNDPFSMMFQIPWLLTMSIAAAWMYRSLQDFLSNDIACPPSYMTSHNFGHTLSSSGTRAAPVPVPLYGIEVDTHMTVTAHGQSLISQTSHNSLGRETDKAADDKPLGAV